VVVAATADVGCECGWDMEDRREAPPTKPVWSLSFPMSVVSIVPAEPCLERRFSLLKIDFSPFEELGEVGEVGETGEVVSDCTG
jgi:hypothetical protein